MTAARRRLPRSYRSTYAVHTGRAKTEILVQGGNEPRGNKDQQTETTTMRKRLHEGRLVLAKLRA